MTGGSVDVSVIIVTWNSGNYIYDCLRSIHDFSRTTTFEVLVVDNGSSDGTVTVARDHFPGVRIVQTGSNLGFPRANNLALRYARGRFVFLLNPDTCLKSDVVGDLVRFLESHPEAGAACPKILEGDGTVSSFAVRDLPSLRDTFLTQCGIRKAFPGGRFVARSYLAGLDGNRPMVVPFIAGAAVMLPRVIFSDVGLLDEQLPMYFEDLDICARIRATGRFLYVVPSAIIVHMGGKSADLSPVRALLFALENGQAPWLYMKTYRGRGHALMFTLIVFTGNILRLGVMPLLILTAMPRWGGRAGQIKRHMVKSTALLKWSLTPTKEFEKRVDAMFS